MGPGSRDYRQAGLQSSTGERGSRSWEDHERLYDERGAARAEPRALNQIMKGSTGGLVGWAVAHREAPREKPVSGSRKQERLRQLMQGVCSGLVGRWAGT